MTKQRTTNKIHKDHLGNKFQSIAEMCAYWNVPYITFYQRRKNGWSLEKSLTCKINTTNSTPCKDHLGNEFPSITKMCEHWKIPYVTFFQRQSSGWALNEILEPQKYRPCKKKPAVASNQIHIELDMNQDKTIDKWLKSQKNTRAAINHLLSEYIKKYGDITAKENNVQIAYGLVDFLLKDNNVHIIEYWLTHGMNISETATKFKMHRNKLAYRIKKLQQCGINLNSLDGISELINTIKDIKSHTIKLEKKTDSDSKQKVM